MDEQNKKIYDPIQVNQDLFDDNDEVREDFYAKVRITPGPVLDILFGTDTPTKIEKICSNHGLDPEQSAKLSRLIREVLIGDVFVGDMPLKISQNLGLEPALAKQLSNSIIANLFAPALDDIKSIQRQKFPGRVAGPPTTASPVPGEDLPETGGNIIDLRQK